MSEEEPKMIKVKIQQEEQNDEPKFIEIKTVIDEEEPKVQELKFAIIE